MPGGGGRCCPEICVVALLPPPPPKYYRMTDACKNINFARFATRAVNIRLGENKIHHRASMAQLVKCLPETVGMLKHIARAPRTHLCLLGPQVPPGESFTTKYLVVSELHLYLFHSPIKRTFRLISLMEFLYMEQKVSEFRK